MRRELLGLCTAALALSSGARAQSQQPELRVIAEQSAYQRDVNTGRALVVVHILRVKAGGDLFIQMCGWQDVLILERDSAGTWVPVPWSQPCLEAPWYTRALDMFTQGMERVSTLSVAVPGRYIIRVKFGAAQLGPFDKSAASQPFVVGGLAPATDEMGRMMAQIRSADTPSVNLTYQARRVRVDRSMCQPSVLDSNLALAFARDIDRVQSRGAVEFAPKDLDVESVGVATDSGCVSAYLFHGDQHFGGLVLRDATGHVVDDRPFFYQGGRDLRTVGRNRVALEYIDSWGTGVLVRSLVVLCSFGTTHWVECLHQPVLERQSVEGVAEGYSYERIGDAAFHGDTVDVHYRFHFDGASTWDKDLGVTRYVLP